MTRSTVRFALTAVSAVAVLVGLVVGAVVVAPAAVAQTSGEATTTTSLVPLENSPLGNILPRPNSGRPADSPNDPGGWQQYLVFGLILAGLAAIFGLAVRESRRARARQGRLPARR